MSKPQIVICGSVAIDRIMNFSGRYRDLIKPDKLHVLSLSTLLDQLEDSRGGIGANISMSLALLGEHPTLIGSVGPDAKGYVHDLEALGINISSMHESQLRTASFNVITDSEDSQVGGFYQGAMSDSESVSFEPWFDQDILAVISAHNPAAMNRQVKECLDNKLRLVYDPGQQVVNDETDLKAGVMAAEVLFVNDYEMSILCDRTGLSADEIKQKVPYVITTLGRDGSIVEGSKTKRPVEISAAKLDAEVDPTGAGDGYRAGFLYGFVRNWELEQCAQLGATVASFIVEVHGTQRNFSKQDIINRYKESFNEKLELE